MAANFRDPAFWGMLSDTFGRMAWAPVQPNMNVGEPMQQYQQKQQEAQQKNATLEWLKANDPEAYQYAQAGAPVTDALKFAMERKQQAAAPKKYEYRTMGDNSLVALDPYDPSNVKTVFQGQPKLPPIAQETEWFNSLPPEKQKQVMDYRAAQRASTTVNVNSGENSFEKKLAEGQATMFNDMAKDGMSARADLSLVDGLETMMKDRGGALDGVSLQLSKYGIGGEGVSDLQAIDATISKLVPAQRPPGSGTMSDRDIELFKASLPSLWNQPGGNQLILATMRGLAQYKAAQGEIANRVLAGQMTREEAQQALMNLPDPLSEFKQLVKSNANPGTAGKTSTGVPWSIVPEGN